LIYFKIDYKKITILHWLKGYCNSKFGR